MNKYLIILLIGWAPFIKGQKGIMVNFYPMYKGQLLSENQTMDYQGKDINITGFKCYLTAFELWENGQLVWKEDNSYHLLDATQLASTSLNFALPDELDYNEIKFSLGVDSLTSVGGVMGGDLDPTKGMYWAWNSGYINFKLEGISPLCTARKNKFQYHLGGYNGSMRAVQKIALKIDSKEIIDINIQTEKFLTEIDLEKQHSIMSPSLKAVHLSKLAATIFSIQ
jgi:hypothetical protein